MTDAFAQSESILNLATAMAAAQVNARAANKSSSNPHFGSKYADLAEVVQVHKECFAPLGISYVQFPLVGGESEVRLVTILMHSTGEWMRSIASLPTTKNNPQAFGSAYTYARRYALAAALGIAADDDDDANAASGAPTKTAEKKESAPAPTISLDELAALLAPISDAADPAALDKIAGAIAKQNPQIKEQIKQAYGVRKAVLDAEAKRKAA